METAELGDQSSLSSSGMEIRGSSSLNRNEVMRAHLKISDPSLSSCVTPDKWLNLSEPLFSGIWNETHKG